MEAQRSPDFDRAPARKTRVAVQATLHTRYGMVLARRGYNGRQMRLRGDGQIALLGVPPAVHGRNEPQTLAAVGQGGFCGEKMAADEWATASSPGGWDTA